MRHILLARVEVKTEELMTASYNRQTLQSITTSSSSFTCMGSDYPENGQGTCRTISSSNRLGCIKSTSTSSQTALNHCRQGCSLLLRINCFSRNYSPFQYLINTSPSIPMLITDCSPNTAFLLSPVKCKKASSKDSKIEVSPRLVRKNLVISSCQCRNLVRCESSNCLSSYTSFLGSEASVKISPAESGISKQFDSRASKRPLSLSFNNFEKAYFRYLVTGSSCSTAITIIITQYY